MRKFLHNFKTQAMNDNAIGMSAKKRLLTEVCALLKEKKQQRV